MDADNSQSRTPIRPDDGAEDRARAGTSIRPPRRLSLLKKTLFAAVVTVAVFAVFELVLRSVWRSDLPPDPFVGFSSSVPLLVDGDQKGTVRISDSKLVWFNDRTFAATKPAGTYRIVCLGGSTTFGRPYDEATSLSGWMQELLPMVAPQKDWEVINAGGVSYASYRIASVMEEFSRYDVDLFVLYTGQNEFLEWRSYGQLMNGSGVTRQIAALADRSRTGRLVRSVVDAVRERRSDPKYMMSGEVDEMLNHSIGPSSYERDVRWQKQVEEHFRYNLERMRRIAHNADVPLVVVTPVSNLRDCAPFKGDFADALQDDLRSQLAADLLSARSEYEQSNDEIALGLLESILDQDRENADVFYWRGKTLLRLGRFEEAADSFQQAIDLDICALRATTPIKSAVRELMGRPDVIAVDYENRLAERVTAELGHSCFGSESFLDHVHPTVEVHGDLAVAIIEQLDAEGIVAEAPTPAQIAQAAERIGQRLDRETQGVAFRNLAKVMHWAGRFDEAQRHAENALRLMPEDLESLYVMADCMKIAGDEAGAVERYTKLFQMGNFSRACLPFADLLAAEGHFEAAKAMYLQAILSNTGLRQASAYASLGRLHEQLSEPELAEECFENAEKLGLKDFR